MGFFKTTFFKSWVAASFIVTTAMISQSSANWSSQEPQTRKHMVRQGETLSIIARNYGFEAKELIEYNKLQNPTRLQVGQVIYFPTEVEAEFSNQTSSSESRGLDAAQFPPPSYEPSAEEYYQLQQFMNGKEPLKPTNEVDYNFINKPNAELEKPVFPEEVAKPAPVPKNENNGGSKDMSLDAGDAVGDKDSPALSAFGDRPYAYFGNGEDLTEVLQNFAASYYIPTSIAEGVIGEVNGKIGPLTPVDFLDHMANIYGYIWYFDGHTLYVYGGSSAVQQIISLNHMSVDDFKKTLKKVGIWDGRFYWKAQPKDGLVYISGPPRYVEMVAQTAMLLDEKEGERQKSRLTVRMFRLKYAWATDKTFPFRGQEITVPGVATLLENIISGGGVAKITRQAISNQKVQPVEAAKGLTRSAQEEKAADKANKLNDGVQAESVYINADPRLNAIIVHDLESKMPMYEELIASLDKPTSQIEVTVSIIDINSDDLEALGVEWSRNAPASGVKDNDFEFDPFPNPDLKPSFTTIVQASMGAFNAKLNLLAQDGKVKIVSRPSILTLDNLEAVLDSSNTFYVSVAGERDAELFPVTSGTVVQVTPRIVREEAGRRIHLSVNIQDGTGAQAQGSTLPTVNNSSISTQAIIFEQESLLVGGFYKEREEEFTSKVPVLGDLPVLGHLFKGETSQKTKQVRLFLITPRIVGIERT